MKYFFILIFLFSFPSMGHTQEFQHKTWTDIEDSFALMFDGGFQQFKEPNSWKLFAYTSIPLAWSFNRDDTVTQKATATPPRGVVKSGNWLGVVFSFPIYPVTAYIISRRIKDEKLLQYSKEVFAATNVALFESAVLSYIDIHERPIKTELSKFETEFRGDSSFPSGHVVPFFVMTFKTAQYYGPYWALVPLGTGYLASLQRVKSGKHTLSDIIGAFLISGMASEGIRAANGDAYLHPFYKWLFDHEVRATYNRKGERKTYGLRWSF